MPKNRPLSLDIMLFVHKLQIWEKSKFLSVISDSDVDFIYKQFSDANINRYLFDAEPVQNIDEAKE